MLRKEKKDAMARWVAANDVSLEQVTRYFLHCFLIELGAGKFFSREETASQKIDLRLRAMARVADHKAVRSYFNC